MVEKRKVLEIPEELMDSDWKSNSVTIKKLSFGEQMRIRDEASKIKVSDGGVDGTINQEVAMVSYIVKSVVEAPWKINDNKSVADLDGAFGNWLLGEIQDFNSFSIKKKGG